MPHHPQRSGWKLAIVLFPFVWGAAFVNLFMLSLGWQALGMSALSPASAMLLALPISVPADFLCVRWVKSLIHQAER